MLTNFTQATVRITHLTEGMFNHTSLSRLFLLGLGVVGFYSAVSDRPLEAVALFPCLFRCLTDLVCPGCGMTRACLAIVRGEFDAAWNYHPFSFFLLGLAILTAFFPYRLKRTWSRCSPLIQNLILTSGIVFCLSIWLRKIKDSLG